MKVSFFPSAHEPQGEQRDFVWSDLVTYLTTIVPRTTKDGALYSLAEYETVKRANDNVVAIHGAVIDYDKNSRSPESVLKMIPGITCAWHSTFGNDVWLKKWRLVVPFESPVSPGDWPDVWQYLYEQLGCDEAIDISCKALSRAYYSPSCPFDKMSISFSGNVEGKLWVPKKVTKLVPVYESVEIPQDEMGTALSYIPSDDYKEWIDVGMAIKAECGDSGYAYFDDWSKRSAKYGGSKETRKKWDSFQATGITVGTLYHYAQRAGWIPKPPEEYVHQVEVNIQKPTVNRQSTDIMDAPNLVGQIKDYILSTALYPQPRLALAAAISMAGTMMAHKVQGATGLRTNMYTLGLAPSGSGKEHQRQCNIKMLREVHMSNHLIGKIASAPGLLYALHDSDGRGLHQMDEVGKYLKSMMSGKASSYLQEVPTVMMELFSQASSVFLGSQYSKRDNKEERIDIEQPCLCVFGTTAPNRFYEAMTGDEVLDGFLSRWLVFEADDYGIEEADPESLNIPEDLLHELRYWAEKPINDNPRGNLDVRPEPMVVKPTGEAKDILKAFRRQCRENIAGSVNDGIYAAIWSRAAEHAEKAALCAHSGGRIEASVMQWAIAVAEYSANLLYEAVMDNMASNDHEAEIKKVLGWIKGKRKWLLKSEIVYGTRWLKKSRRNEILSDLVESGQVEMVEEKGDRGAPMQKFRCKTV